MPLRCAKVFSFRSICTAHFYVLTNYGRCRAPGIEGVVFLSELDQKKIEDPAESFSTGEERIAKIIKMNQKDKKISLSFKQAQLDMQKLEYQKYIQSQDKKLTLGDIMKSQFQEIQSSKKKNKKKEEKDD